MNDTKFVVTQDENSDSTFLIDFIKKLKVAKNTILKECGEQTNEDDKIQFFYRGQASYLDMEGKENEILPSIFRNGNLDKERIIYNKVKVECSSEFEGCKTHLDILTKMQHYGVPTRLLDITGNALTALYFACDDGIKNKTNENVKDVKVIVYGTKMKDIKFPNSDTVSILASIPLMNVEDRNNLEDYARGTIRMDNDRQHEFTSSEWALFWENFEAIKEYNVSELVKKLVHEVRNEKPGFRFMVNPYDIVNRYIVLSEKKNDRMIMQDGAFIIYGLYNSNKKFIVNDKNEVVGEIKDNIFEVTIHIKKQDCQFILNELKDLGIKTSTVYPEMDRVAEELKNK